MPLIPDLMDPLGPYRLSRMFRRQEEPTIPELSPEEESGVLRKLGGNVMSGLGWVGQTLDKPGRAVRGLLSGRPGELANLIPFSDTLGITDPEEGTTGLQLLQNAGLVDQVPKGEEGWGQTLAGIGAEIALDPLAFLSFGTKAALTPAGVAAKKAGTLSKTAKGRIAGGQSGLASVGLPFTQGTAIGTGPRSQAVAGFLDDAGDWLKYTAPIRRLSEGFDSVVRGASRESLQRAMRAGQDARVADEDRLAKEVFGIGRKAKEAGVETETQQIRRLAEVVQQTNLGQPDVIDAADAIRLLDDQMLAKLKGAGADVRPLRDTEAIHVNRQSVTPDIRTSQKGPQKNRQIPTKQGPQLARENILRNMPGGTERLSDVSVDPLISGIISRTGQNIDELLKNQPDFLDQATERYRDFYLKTTKADAQGIRSQLRAEKALSKDVQDALRKYRNGTANSAEESLALQAIQGGQAVSAKELGRFKAYGLAPQSTKFFAALDPQHADKNLRLFGNHVFEDVLSGLKKSNEVVHNNRAITDAFVAELKPAKLSAPGDVRLDKALKQAGLNTKSNPQFVQDLEARIGGPLAGHYVPLELVQDAVKLQQPGEAPGFLKPLLSATDKFTNLFRSGVTAGLPFPSFHVRNLFSGLFSNLQEGALTGPGNVVDAKRMLQGDTLEGISKLPMFAGQGLTDEQSTKRVADLAASLGVYNPHSSVVADVLAQPGGPAQQFFDRIPGNTKKTITGSAIEGFKDTFDPQNFTQGYQKFKDSPANPLNIKGVRSESDVFGLGKAGREITGQVEGVNRLSGFLGLLEQGYAPEVARDIVKRSQGGKELTQFEKQWMRRLVPFYQFSRSNIPQQTRHLLENPGGLSGQMVRATTGLRSKSDFLPEYLGSGLAIPFGSEEDNQQRFLTKLDLPYEQPLELLSAGPNAGLRTVEKLLGQTNPLLKTPLELLSGRQMYSGRELDDLWGPSDNVAVSQLWMNSPISRLITTGRMLTDDRKDPFTKATNFLSGVRLSDVDMAKQRDVFARQLAEELMEADPQFKKFERFFVPKDQLPNLTPEELTLMQLYRTLEKKSKDRQKKEQTKAR